MDSRRIPKRALASFRNLCRSGWPAPTLVPALLEALHGLIPSTRNLFDWTDADGRLVHYYVEGSVNTNVARLYFDEFHNRLERQWMPAFSSLVDAPASVRGAAELNHPGFFQSALYNEIWRPQGLHTRIEGVIRSRAGKLLGSLVLYRGPREPAFGPSEEQMLACLLPYIAGALECCPAADAMPVQGEQHVPSCEPAETILMDWQGRILHTSPGASRLLLLADEGLTPQAVSRPMGEVVHRLFGRLILQLRERMASETLDMHQGGPSLTRINGYGRFDARVTPLWAEDAAPTAQAGLLQLIVRRLEPRTVAIHRVLRELPVSAGQASVCVALCSGHAQPQIARDLGVAASTVVDHARKLYRALNVSGAAELRDLVDCRLSGTAY